GAGPVDAEEARARDAVVVQLGPAHVALAAADPREHQPLLPDLHAFRPGAELFHHAERLVAHRERRHAAALLHVEALAAAPVEVAVPDVQVAVADAGAGDADQDLGAFRHRRLEDLLLKGLAVLDHLP